jgi:hypothetical protein
VIERAEVGMSMTMKRTSAKQQQNCLWYGWRNRRRLATLEDDKEEVDQLEEDELKAKRARFEATRLLDFQGLVSFQFDSHFPIH